VRWLPVNLARVAFKVSHPMSPILVRPTCSGLPAESWGKNRGRGQKTAAAHDIECNDVHKNHSMYTRQQ
jgi:hypothetical protein